MQNMARPKGAKVININESNKLLHKIGNSQVTCEEALKMIENICSDINKLTSMQSIKSNQVNVINTLFMVIFKIFMKFLLEKVRALG